MMCLAGADTAEELGVSATGAVDGPALVAVGEILPLGVEAPDLSDGEEAGDDGVVVGVAGGDDDEDGGEDGVSFGDGEGEVASSGAATDGVTGEAAGAAMRDAINADTNTTQII
ncbi:hypothetical protein KI387_040252, partial [Taxus chinensis]